MFSVARRYGQVSSVDIDAKNGTCRLGFFPIFESKAQFQLGQYFLKCSGQPISRLTRAYVRSFRRIACPERGLHGAVPE